MKSILYVGATLMIGASIYGFVDYKNTSRNEEFTGMYEEKKETAPIVTVSTDEKTVVPAVIKETVSTPARKAVKRKSQKTEEIVPVIEPIKEEEMISGSETKVIENTTVDLEPAKEYSITKQVKKKKKLNTKIFSRAPIREIEEEDLVLEPKEKLTKKSDRKQ